jgi:hypothetical protein
MTKIVFTSVVVAGLLGCSAASAQAAEREQVYFIAGNSCTSLTSGQTPKYSQNGIYASGAAAIDVTCPITVDGHVEHSETYMYIYGHSRSANDRVSCTIMTSDAFGQRNNLFRYQRIEVPSTGSPASAGSAVLKFFFREPLSVFCRLPAPTSAGNSYLTLIELYVR